MNFSLKTAGLFATLCLIGTITANSACAQQKQPTHSNGPLKGTIKADFSPAAKKPATKAAAKPAQRVVQAQPERLLPADPHRKPAATKIPAPPTPRQTVQPPVVRRTTPNPNPPQPPRQNPPQPPRQNPPPRPNPPQPPPGNAAMALFQRLGLVDNKAFATGKVMAISSNGSVAHLSATYKATRDGRLMIFPVGSDRRLDVHSAQFNAPTNVLACQFIGIDLTAARNSGSGDLNFSMAGSGPVFATIQDQARIVGNETVIDPGRRVSLLFVPN